MGNSASFSSRVLGSLVIAAVSSFSFAGCGEITKVQECNAVIDTINGGSGIFKEWDDDPKKADDQIKKLEEFEKKIGEVKITDGELKKHVDEYRSMVTDMGKLSKDLKDGKVEGIDKRSKDITNKEDELVKKINGYCQRQ